MVPTHSNSERVEHLAVRDLGPKPNVEFEGDDGLKPNSEKEITQPNSDNATTNEATSTNGVTTLTPILVNSESVTRHISTTGLGPNNQSSNVPTMRIAPASTTTTTNTLLSKSTTSGNTTMSGHMAELNFNFTNFRDPRDLELLRQRMARLSNQGTMNVVNSPSYPEQAMVVSR